MTNRRDFIRRGSLWLAASAVAAYGLEEATDRASWVKRLFPVQQVPWIGEGEIFYSLRDGRVLHLRTREELFRDAMGRVVNSRILSPRPRMDWYAMSHYFPKEVPGIMCQHETRHGITSFTRVV